MDQLDLEQAERMLFAYGYHSIVRYDHLHAIWYHQSPDLIGTKEREDERHLCTLTELPRYTDASFVHLLHQVFQQYSCTASPGAVSPFL